MGIFGELWDDAKQGAGDLVNDGAHVIGDGLNAVGLHSAAQWVDTEGDKIGYALGAGVGELQLGQSDDPKELVHGDAAADAFRAKFSPEPAKWSAASSAMGQASSALESYGSAVESAQSQAQRAIDLWNQGQEATKQAAAAYNQQVNAYNSAAQAYNSELSADQDPGTKPTAPGTSR
jgi:hypothetical protein